MTGGHQLGASSVPFGRAAYRRASLRLPGREEHFLIAVLAVCGIVDWLHLIRFGETSALAILTVLWALLSWCLWLVQARGKRHVSRPVRPFLLFLAWVLASLAWAAPTTLGVQNVVLLMTFAGVLLLSENTVASAGTFPAWVGKSLVGATFTACGFYIAFMLIDGLGTDLVFHARSFAIFVLLGLAWFLAGWRYGSIKDLAFAVFIVTLIVLSLSRMAFATSLLTFLLAWIVRRGRTNWFKLAAVVFLVAGLAYSVVSDFGPFHDRFAAGADGLDLSGREATSYTSGRLEYWLVTLSSAMDSPWIGQGAGSSSKVLNDMFPWIEHPHDEYLRVFHDYGLVGLVLFLWSVGMLFRATWVNWRLAERMGRPDSRLHLAAFLALFAVFFTMISENSLVYLFMMAPLAVLVGASLGRGSSSAA